MKKQFVLCQISFILLMVFLLSVCSGSGGGSGSTDSTSGAPLVKAQITGVFALAEEADSSGSNRIFRIISGSEVVLKDASGTIVSTTQTDAFGKYSFDGRCCMNSN